jgi:glutamyl/glutaminyl-tRNA synthetase
MHNSKVAKVLQGVTHALRTSEYKDREEQFYRIHRLMQQSNPKLPPVVIWDYSRLNFVHTGALPSWSAPKVWGHANE